MGTHLIPIPRILDFQKFLRVVLASVPNRRMTERNTTQRLPSMERPEASSSSLRGSTDSINTEEGLNSWPSYQARL